MIDKPHPDKEGGVRQFLDKNKHLETGNQFFQLTLQRAIEQCYPDKKCSIYTNWKKSQEEVDKMKGRKKQLAKHVGDNISKEQFESDLEAMFQCLTKMLGIIILI